MKPILLHPAYFTSILQMAVVAQSNEIVFEGEDNYQKQTYRNRAYIAHSNGKLLLNAPIKHTKDGAHQKYKDVGTETNFPWISQHWKSLQSAYRTSPYFEFYEDDLAPLFKKKVPSLFTHNIEIFETICDLLGMDQNYMVTSEYVKNPLEQLDVRKLIEVKFKTPVIFPKYTQVLQEPDDFLPNLSVLDLLFNEGPNSLNYLENIDLDVLFNSNPR